MSRQYDAAQTVRKIYPEYSEAASDLFLEIVDVSESDFEYEEGMSPREYIYGEEVK